MRRHSAAMVFDNSDEQEKGSIIRKPGSKRLYILFYYLGERIEKSTGLTDTKANRGKVRDWLDRQMEKIEEGRFKFCEAFPGASEEEKEYFSKLEGWEYSPEPRNILFGDYLERWTETIWAKCPSESKKDDYKRIIDARLRPYFAELSFQQITGVEMKRFIASLVYTKGAKKGQQLSGARVRNVLVPLRAIWFDACEEYRWNLPDPFRFVSRHLPRKGKRRPKVFRFAEWKSLLDHMDPHYKIIAEVMVQTGMIASEIAGLRREDIVGDVLHLRNSIVDGREKAELKNQYRVRELPITASLRRLLDEAMGQSAGPYVFQMASGIPFDACNFRKHAWTRAFRESGLEYRVPYTMRHTFAAWSLTIGIHPHRLVRLMGHSSKQMVYEVYGDYVEGLETDAVEIQRYYGEDFLPAKTGKIYQPNVAQW